MITKQEFLYSYKILHNNVQQLFKPYLNHLNNFKFMFTSTRVVYSYNILHNNFHIYLNHF